MKIDVYFSPAQVDEMQLREKNVVVIDVLRASSTIVAALHNGAREIIPVSSVESAVKVSGNLFGDVVLRGGERNGKMIDGFNLGNSPSEYTEEAVKGKSIILCTTNGSVAMVRARYAKNMTVACFNNISSVVEFMEEINDDFSIVCAGQQSLFALEDAVCAGMIVKQLSDKDSLMLELNDAAVTAHVLYKTYNKNLLKMIKSCDHGRYLAGIGFEDDLKLCAEIDSVATVPMLAGSVIKVKKEAMRPSVGNPLGTTAEAVAD
ncbi:MAG: 2-phosphosulfolactate phosphatase [Bacteroidota bacterium]|nr:2-phosphosulfolactate phosphatase [Bacteroidota bacterium]